METLKVMVFIRATNPNILSCETCAALYTYLGGESLKVLGELFDAYLLLFGPDGIFRTNHRSLRS